MTPAWYFVFGLGTPTPGQGKTPDSHLDMLRLTTTEQLISTTFVFTPGCCPLHAWRRATQRNLLTMSHVHGLHFVGR